MKAARLLNIHVGEHGGMGSAGRPLHATAARHRTKSFEGSI
jgi:hypothetical protein